MNDDAMMEDAGADLSQAEAEGFETGHGPGETVIEWVGVKATATIRKEAFQNGRYVDPRGLEGDAGCQYGLLINDVSGSFTLAFASGSEVIDSGFTIPQVPVYLTVTVNADLETARFAVESAAPGMDLIPSEVYL